jgi:hypothetical protein
MNAGPDIADPAPNPKERVPEMSTTPTGSAVSLQRIKRETAVIEVEGTAPLIVHQWSEKARRMMLDSQQGRKTPKVAKDPHQNFLDSMYRFDGVDRGELTPLDSHGIPTMGLKAATVKGGARAFGKSVKMTELRQSLLFVPDGLGSDGLQLTRLTIASEPKIREDLVRVGMGTADLRYRAEYRTWGATIRVEFMPNVIDLGSIVALVDAGGANGVGEWRPERSGSFGTYRVAGESLA